MKKNTIYALGFFDGVHIGHAALLRECRRLADQQGCTAAAVTLTEKQEKCCRNGVAFTTNLAEGTYRVYAQNGEFLALSHMVEGKLTTIKSFWTV